MASGPSSSYRDPALELARPHDPVRAIADADGVLADNRFPEFVLPICERRAAARHDPSCSMPTSRRTAGRSLLTLATHVVFSADGLRATARTADLAAALAWSPGSTDAFVAVTDGAARRAVAGGRRRCAACRCFAVEAVDTLGAGDVFHGAFALALAEGRARGRGHAFRGGRRGDQMHAALAAVPGAPGRAEVDAFLARHRCS